MEKQITFWKEKWSLKRIDGRCDGQVPMSDIVDMQRGCMTIKFFGGGSAFRQKRDSRITNVFSSR